MKALIIYANETEFKKNNDYARFKSLLESLGFVVVNVWFNLSPSDDEYISKSEIDKYDLIIQKGVDLGLKCKARFIHIDNGHPKAFSSDPSIPNELTHEQHDAIVKVTKRLTAREKLESWRLAIFATLASLAGCIWLATAIANYFNK